jgi:hypothetical protein
MSFTTTRGITTLDTAITVATTAAGTVATTVAVTQATTVAGLTQPTGTGIADLIWPGMGTGIADLIGDGDVGWRQVVRATCLTH